MFYLFQMTAKYSVVTCFTGESFYGHTTGVMNDTRTNAFKKTEYKARTMSTHNVQAGTKKKSKTKNKKIDEDL